MRKPTLKQLTEFTLEGYTDLLKYLGQIYKILPFCRVSTKNTPYLILRHDVDFSLDAALEMAKLERKLGISSTYFVLFRWQFYDVLKQKNARTLREISNLGHEIGLHFEPSRYRSHYRSMNEGLQTEVSQLEALLGKKVCSISRHGPWDRDPFASTKGYINANHPYWRSDLFIHDSCRAWATIEDLSMLLNSPPRTVQILVHPANWQKEKIDRATLFERLFQLLEGNYPDFTRRMKKIWLTDPLVLRYEHSIQNEEMVNCCDKELLSPPKPKSSYGKQLKYYQNVARWYLINSEIGWRIHENLDKIKRGRPAS